MALSRVQAKKIIEVVAADAECKSRIDPHPTAGILFTIPAIIGEFTNTAGAVRNIPLVLKGIVQGKNMEDDPESTKLLCIGIVESTTKAIIAAIRKGKLPGVHIAGAIPRVNWGIHHTATWIRMEDDSEYAFDWHATLQINDPAISKAADWLQGKNAVNYVLFMGFKKP